MATVFKDEKLNAHFNKYGYAVAPVLSASEVEALKVFYLNNPNPFKAEFHTTHFSTDKNYKQSVHDAIIGATQRGVHALLNNYVPAFGNYMVKEAGGNNPMPLHADWAYVDESAHTSVAIWIPLVDTTIENGCLGVIPFSQHLSWHIRGPRILQWTPPYNEQLVNGAGKLIPVKAGTGIIYNHRLIHYSPPNNSGQVRPAINLSLVPQGVQVLHYTVPEGKEGIHCYEVDNFDFFIHYDNFQVPERGRLREVISLDSVPLINNRVEAFIKQYAAKPGLLEKIKAVFAG